MSKLETRRIKESQENNNNNSTSGPLCVDSSRLPGFWHAYAPARRRLREALAERRLETAVCEDQVECSEGEAKELLLGEFEGMSG